MRRNCVEEKGCLGKGEGRGLFTKKTIVKCVYKQVL